MYPPAVLWIRVRIRIKLNSRIRINTNVINWIRINTNVINWIRIRIRINLQMRRQNVYGK
jgi:hypothetical protein